MRDTVGHGKDSPGINLRPSTRVCAEKSPIVLGYGWLGPHPWRSAAGSDGRPLLRSHTLDSSVVSSKARLAAAYGASSLEPEVQLLIHGSGRQRSSR